MSEQNKELEILAAMRKVLGSIIRDLTPSPGTRHPLKDETIQDVRTCLGLITAREQELTQEPTVGIRVGTDVRGDVLGRG